MSIKDILKPQQEWEIIDASKIRTYMSCPRKYFFNYVLGWVPNVPNNNFVFGNAWHVAMEHLLLNNYSDASLAEASEMFVKRYREELGPETDDLYFPKSPTNGLRGLILYHQRYKNDIENYDVMYTEVGGKVRLGEDAIMAFKIDCIRRDRHTKMIEVLDHKSSQRRINGWDRLWGLSVQLLSYMHALYSLWDFNKIKGGRVRCTFFRSKTTEFEEVSIRKTPADMESFITDILTYYDMLRKDMYLLMETCSEDEPSMPAFPRCPESCYSYGRICEYFDVCEAWSNPLQECHTIPPEYHVVHWNPLDDPRLRHEVDLT